MSYCGQNGMPSTPSPPFGNARATDTGADAEAAAQSGRGGSALDCLLAVLKTPALAADLALRTALWTEIKRLADIHRFLGLLAYSSSSWLPPSERQWRDRVLMIHHRRHVQRLAALRRLIDAFNNEGMACVSLKGPLLAERFYALPFLRPSNDLDLLIHERDAAAAVQLMTRLGFQPDGRYPWHLQRRLVQHLTFVAPGDSPRVEVHYQLYGGNGYLDASGFVDRSVAWRSAAGFDSRVMSTADEAFYSCVHAGNHAFHRLRWLYDVITIARTLTPEERSRVRGLAIGLGQSGLFVAAGMAGQEFFGEAPELGCADFPVPWLLTRLTPRQVRRMVERVAGTASGLSEKLGYRLDFCRMAGSPLRAAGTIAFGLDLELRKRWYELRNPVDPSELVRSLAD